MATQNLKIDLINSALQHLTISGITTPPDSDEIASAVLVLEEMMAELADRNADVGYRFEDDPEPNTPSGVPRAYQYAIAVGLATRLAPSYGKSPGDLPGLWRLADASMARLLASTAQTRELAYPRRMPIGSGNRRYGRYGYRFYRDPPQAPVAASTNKMVVGDINDYTEHFDAYLGELETIADVTVSASAGLELVSSSRTDRDVNYRIEAQSTTTNATGIISSTGYATVTISVTTSTGRVANRTINFQVNAC